MRDHERIARLQEQLIAADNARKLQAIEYERRLDALNHEAQRIAARDVAFVGRDVYDAEQHEIAQKFDLLVAASNDMVRRDDYDTKHTALQDRVDKLEDFKNRAVGGAVILTGISAAVGAAIFKILGG